MITPFMNLNLPTPSVTLGPIWAANLNTALELIDEHDHSNGKGTTIKTAGIEINADLDIRSFSLFGLKSLKLQSQVATLTGPTNAQSLFSYNGDLYYTSGSGTAVQLTSGGGIVPIPSAVESMAYSNVAGDVTIDSATSDVVLGVDTSAVRVIELPLAADVSVGRIFVIKDATGNSETNPITLKVKDLSSDLIDGTDEIQFGNNYGALYLVSDGFSRWLII